MARSRAQVVAASTPAGRAARLGRPPIRRCAEAVPLAGDEPPPPPPLLAVAGRLRALSPKIEPAVRSWRESQASKAQFVFQNETNSPQPFWGYAAKQQPDMGNDFPH